MLERQGINAEYSQDGKIMKGLPTATHAEATSQQPTRLPPAVRVEN